MSKTIRIFAPLSVLLAFAVALSACQTVAGLPPYDAAAAQRTAELKVETRELMRKSGERYSRHASEVEGLTRRIETAYELAAAAPNNKLVAQQWAIMKNPDGALYGGFVKRWKENGTIKEAFRHEIAAQVEEGFDLILCLETAKRQPVQCNSGGAT